MLKINKKVEYALMALKFIASKGDEELTSAREICDQLKTPFDTTAKVMQTMNNAKILESVQGINGGYSLAMDLSKISFAKLTQIIEGDSSFHAKPCKMQATCNIHGPISNLNKQLCTFLNKITLKELLLSEHD